MTKKREFLFRVTKKDLTVQTFRSGGKGGQRQNKVETGVRIIHAESGAAGESRSARSQHQNKRLALARLAKSEKFMAWVRIKAARVTATETLDDQIDRLMQPHNLLIQQQSATGQWVKYSG